MSYFKKLLFGLTSTIISLMGVGFGFAATGDISVSYVGVTPSLTNPLLGGGSGGTVQITLRVTNSGASLDPYSGSSLLTFTYPSQITPNLSSLPAGWSCVGQVCSFTGITLLATGAFSGYTLNGTINSNVPYTIVSFTGNFVPHPSFVDTISTNNTAVRTLAIGYDGLLTKTVSSTALPGVQYANRADIVAYTISYYNSGTMPVAVNFIDNLPQGLVVLPLGITVSCSTGGSLTSFNATTNALFVQNCVIFPNTTGVVWVSGIFDTPTYINNTITNTATGQIYVNGGSSLNIGGSLLNMVSANALLFGYPVLQGFSKTFTGNLPQQIGDVVQYTVSITNSGSVTGNVVLTDTPPPGLAYSSSSPSLGTPTTNPLNTNLVWNLSIPANTTNTYVLSFVLNNSLLLSGFTNTGSLSTGTNVVSGTVFVNPRIVSAFTPVAGFPYITLNKSIISPANGYLYQSGDLVSYRITLTNTGSWTGMGMVTDTLPSQISSWTSSPAPSTMNGSVWTWTGLTVLPGQPPLTIFLTGRLNANYSGNTLYTNTAAFTLQSPLSGTVVNNGIATGFILGRPNLVITKTLLGQSASATLSGDLVSYLLTVQNTGTALYTGSISVCDTFPSQINYVASSLALVSGPTACLGAAWSGTLSPTFTVVVTGVLNTNLSVGQVITNTGTVSTTPVVTEFVTSDNINAVSFVAGGSADVSIDKSLSGSFNGSLGSLATYILRYNNGGQISGLNVVLSDFLPYPLLYSGQISGPLAPSVTSTSTGTLLVWNLGTLGVGQSGTIVFQGYFSGFVASGTIINTGTITTTTPDVALSNNTDSVTTVMTPLSDIQITKTILTPAQGVSGSLVSFLLSFVNNGSTGTSFNVFDTMVSGLFNMTSFTGNLQTSLGTPITFIQAPSLSSDYTLRGSNAYLLPGQTGFLIFTGQLLYQPLTGLSYTNTAYVTGMTNDGNPTNNSSTVTGFMSVSIGCILTKTQLTSPWMLWTPGGIDLSGQFIGYTLTLTNNGTVPLSGITLTDTWPSTELSSPGATTFTSINLPVGSGIVINLSGRLLDRDISSLLNSATATFTMSGTSFSCSGTGDIVRTPVSCNNGYLEGNEQCDTYNGVTHVFNPLGAIQPFQTNSFSFDGGMTTQVCNASCRIQTVAVNNCASMTVSGANPSTLTGCAALGGVTDPVLTVSKTATPTTNLASGSLVRYTITVTNNSSGDAYNVQLSDTFPRSQLQYMGNLTMSAGVIGVSVNTGAQTFTGNFGPMPVGSVRTISFDVLIRNSLASSITNTALVNYTNLANVAMPQISSSVTITLGVVGGACLNGVIDTVGGVTEQCDMGINNALIGNYLNVSGVLSPSFGMSSNGYFDHRGKRCLNCEISTPSANYCGDGQLGMLEQCDLRGAATIGQYLNTTGVLTPAGIYSDGTYTCTVNCEIQRDNKSVASPACWYLDAPISIMEDELLPISWDVEDMEEANGFSTTCNALNIGKINPESLRCTFKIYNKDEENTNGISAQFIRKCTDRERGNVWGGSTSEQITEAFRDDPSFAQNHYGDYLIDFTSTIVNGGYGEYKLSLDEVKYEYCDGADFVPGNSYARVCQINIAVTRPYLMQKTNTVFKPSDPLDDFFVLGYDDRTFVSATQFNAIAEQTQLSSLEYKGRIQFLTEELLKKYDNIAVKLSSSSFIADEVKKVPGSSIYIVDGDVTFAPGDDRDIATTLIVKNGNLIIEGSINSNIMILVPNGSVEFKVAEPIEDSEKKYSSDDNRCDTQVVRGIVVAERFVASNDGKLFNDMDSPNPRCPRGNLHVYGALYGDDIQTLVDSRRSHLEHWFTYELENVAGLSEARMNAERRDEIYKGASVYIEQNPDLWRAMPPGADTFLRTLNVLRE